MSDVDVLVVGAGPTGLTVAAALAQQGIGVRVVDRGAGPVTTSRANILHARGVEVLRRTGAVYDLREQSLSPLGMSMYAGGRRLTTMTFAPLAGESTQALFVSQASIEERLRRRLDQLDVPIEWSTELLTLDPGDSEVSVRLRGPAGECPLAARWVVGCDGPESTVRKQAGIEFPGTTIGEQFLLADVDIDWNEERTHSRGWFHPDGLLLAMPMPGAGGSRESGRRWRLMADVSLDLGVRLSQEQILDRLGRIVATRSGITGARLGTAPWTSVFRINRRLAPDYRRGRVLVAGDAAHIHSPMGGQGMNTGMGDAENLAWKLALVVAGRAATGLLDSYTAERRPLARVVLASTSTNTNVMVGTRGWQRLLRDRVLAPLLNLPGVQARATQGASQLWVSYRNGPLGSRRPEASPRPGDRVPDRPARHSDGTPTRLHDELGRHWVLLGAADDRAAAPARERLGTAMIELTDPDGESPAMLIRPDGHLAWRWSRRDPDPTRWLDRTFGATAR